MYLPLTLTINEQAATPNMLFSVTYNSDLHGAMSFYYRSKILPSEVVNVL